MLNNDVTFNVNINVELHLPIFFFLHFRTINLMTRGHRCACLHHWGHGFAFLLSWERHFASLLHKGHYSFLFLVYFTPPKNLSPTGSEEDIARLFGLTEDISLALDFPHWLCGHIAPFWCSKKLYISCCNLGMQAPLTQLHWNVIF